MKQQSPSLVLAENHGTWGFVPCWFCGGKGYQLSRSATTSSAVCGPCLGLGRLRWVQPNLTVVDNQR